jgi:hypothetical protein
MEAELISSSQLYQDLRQESIEVDAYNHICTTDLIQRTGLDIEQLYRTVIGLDISVILVDNTILNILGFFGFANFEALCIEYIKHVEERMGGMFNNPDDLYENVKMTIQKYTCLVSGSDNACKNCLDAVVKGHVWCLGRMKADVTKAEWRGILNFGILTDNLEIVKCLYKSGARFQECYDSSFGPLVAREFASLWATLIPFGVHNEIRPDFFLPARSIRVMKYCIENMKTPNVITRVAIFGNMELVKFLHESGYPWFYVNDWYSAELEEDGSFERINTSRYAIASGNLELVKYVFENGCIPSKVDIKTALAIDSVEIFLYLRGIGHRLMSSDFYYVAGRNNLNMLKILYNHVNIDVYKIPFFMENLFEIIIDKNHLEMFKFLVDMKTCDMLPRLDRKILISDRPEMLKYLVENGYHVDSKCMFTAIRYKAFECFKYLHEIGYPRPGPVAAGLHED